MKGSLKTRPHVPLQAESAECGLVSVAAISALFGFDISADTLKQKFGSSSRGISLQHLVSMSRRIGFSVQAVVVKPDRFQSLRTPAIALWRDRHFVVVSRHLKRGAEIFDPEYGWSEVDAATIEKNFSGPAIEYPTAPERIDVSNRQRIDLRAWLSRFNLIGRFYPLFAAALITQVLALSLPNFAGKLLDSNLSISAGSAAFSVLGIYLCVSLLSLGVRSVMARIGISLSRSFRVDLKQDVLQQVLAKPVAYLSRFPANTLAGKVQTVHLVELLVSRMFSSTFVQGVLGFGALLVLSFTNFWFMFVVVLGLALNVIVELLTIRRLTAAQERSHRDSVLESNSLIEIIRVAPALRAFRATGRVIEKHREVSVESSESQIAQSRLSQWRSDMNGIVNAVEQTVFLALGAFSISTGAITAGAFVAISFYREYARSGLTELKDVNADYRILNTALSRIEGIVQSTPTEAPEERAIELSLAPDITVNNVCFAYSNFDPSVFRRLSFRVPSGAHVAIVGPSGAGKSTLAALLVGALTPDSGSICYGDVELVPENAHQVLANIGTVMQSDHLFTGTIRENIDFFRGFSDEQVEHAARLANIFEFIMSLPMRWETPVSDEFVGLSGGQRQRLLIARALCGGPKVLIMDEATSFLDAESEQIVGHHIREMNITRVVFAHRQETIRMADLVLDLTTLHEGTLPPELDLRRAGAVSPAEHDLRRPLPIALATTTSAESAPDTLAA